MIQVKKNHTASAFIYTVLLCVIYHIEIVPTWAYMGFSGSLTVEGLLTALIMTVPFSLIFKVNNTAKSYIIISVYYLWIIPSAVYIALSGQGNLNIFIYFLVVISLHFMSTFRVPSVNLHPMRGEALMLASLALVVMVISLQAFYGGLENFNLDIERVYEFRRESADNLPAIFAYVYSNVSSVILPIIIVTAYINRSYVYFVGALALTIILFGMSHHKSVLFSPPVALFLYASFNSRLISRYFPDVFIIIPSISIMEILFTRFFGYPGDISYLTSLIVRRVLFVPAMLDSKYIEFFSDNPFYYWSSSRFFSWATTSDYNLTAPFIIGYEYFRDLDTSANTGIVGSGFSNAGVPGVLAYSMATGLIIAFLNSVAERVGHAFVAAVSFVTIFNILSSADLLTSLLTHGLLLLLIYLLVSPPSGSSKGLAGSAAR